MAEYTKRGLVAVIFVLGGLAVSSVGLFFLQNLNQVYRTVDVAYWESEQTFYDWLAEVIKQRGLASSQLADLIAERLLAMATTDRRDAVNSMMIDIFWDELAPPGTDRTPIFSLMDRATTTALKSLPLAGDLWLFACWLRTMMYGFDDKAADFFLLSQHFTPREKTLVLGRLDLVTQLVKAPSTEVKAGALVDLSVAQRLDPNRAKEYSELLQQ